MLSVVSRYRTILVATLIIAGTMAHSTAMDSKQPASETDKTDQSSGAKRLKSSPSASQTEGSQASVPLSFGESQSDAIEVKTSKQPTNQARRKILYDTLDPMPLELINMIIAYTETTIAEYNEHTASIKAMAFLNGGKYVAAASLDGTIRILNLQTIYEGQSPRCECIIPGHTGYYNCLATLQTQHGELLTNNIPDTCVSLFNPDNKGACVCTLQTKEHEHEVEITPWQPTESQQIDMGPRCSTITSIVPWTQDQMLLGFADDALETWSLKELKKPSFCKTIQVRQSQDKAYRSGFDHIVKLDEKHFAAWQQSTLRIWQLTNIRGVPVRTRKIATTEDITCLTPLPNHKLVCGCARGYVCVYDWQTGECLRQIQPADEEITAIAAQNGERIVFGTEHGAIRVWDPVRAKFATIQAFFAHPVTALLVTPKEGWIIAGFRNGSILVFI